MEIHEILKGLREDKDLTQQNIADILKIGRTMYRRYEIGETEIPIRHDGEPSQRIKPAGLTRAKSSGKIPPVKFYK